MTVEQSMHDIAAILRAERKRRGMTQVQFAELLGISRPYLSQLESGRATTQMARLIRALNAVGVDLVAIPRR